MSQWVFVNTDFIKEENACLHFRDLSIQRGYGIFDFFKVVNGKPVFLDDHLNRFYFSAQEMRLPLSYSRQQLKQIIYELVEKNEAPNIGVRLTLTGGLSPDGYQLSQPNLIIALQPYISPPSDQLEKGIKLITWSHQRQIPHVKTIDYLMAIWLQPVIKEREADDILYHQNGVVSECPRANFFIVTEENKIVTPASKILKGIMRTKIIDLAKEGFMIEEKELTKDEVRTAKEAFITSTTKTILPVRQVDDYIFPGDGEMTMKIFEALLALQSDAIHSFS